MGIPILYRAKDEQPIPMKLVFDERYVLTQGTAEAGVETTAPAVFVPKADIPVSLATDDPQLTIDGSVYRVTERQPDGMGGLVLLLRKIR
jgi:hypothetical protein